MSLDSFHCLSTFQSGGKTYHYFSLPTAAKNGLGDFAKLPISLKVLLENLLRFEDGNTVTKEDIKALVTWLGTQRSQHEIAYRPPAYSCKILLACLPIVI